MQIADVVALMERCGFGTRTVTADHRDRLLGAVVLGHLGMSVENWLGNLDAESRARFDEWILRRWRRIARGLQAAGLPLDRPTGPDPDGVAVKWDIEWERVHRQLGYVSRVLGGDA